MAPKLKEAKYINAYTIWLRFKDGLEGEVDLESELWGGSLRANQRPGKDID